MGNSIFKHATKVLIAAFLISLYGCDGKDSGGSIHEVNDGSFNEHEKLQIQTTLKRYFGSTLDIKKISRGPSGTTKVEATGSGEDTARTLYLLPDLMHVVDGVLYSPYMSAQDISQQHLSAAKPRALLNDRLAVSRDEMRKTISTAIASGKTNEQISDLTKSAINERVKKDSEATSSYLNKVVTTSGPLPQALETASLPRNNSVVDINGIFAEIEKSNWISQGEGRKVLYVFFDFRCNACREVHKVLEKLNQTTSFQVRFIPVGALGPESLQLASLVLSPEDNGKRIEILNELVSSNGRSSNSISKGLSKDDAANGQIRALKNFKTLLGTQKVVTPTFAYRTALGPNISVVTSEAQLIKVIESIKDE